MDSRDRHLQVENVWMQNKTIPATRFVETSIGHEIPLRAKHPSYSHNYTHTWTIVFIDFSVPVPEAASENFGSHSLELWSSVFHDTTLKQPTQYIYVHIHCVPIHAILLFTCRCRSTAAEEGREYMTLVCIYAYTYTYYVCIIVYINMYTSMRWIYIK